MLIRFTRNFLNQAGLSLLEIMVALSILTVAFISLMQAFPQALMINKTAENATKASFLASAKLEELYSLGYGNLAVGVIEPKHRLSADAGNYLYYFQRQTEINYVNGDLSDSAAPTGLKKITVTIYYANALSKAEKTYTMPALLGQW